MRRTPVLLLALAACSATVESIEIPGSGLKHEMEYVSSAPRPFWISRREVTWAEFDRFYEFPEEQKLDGVTRPSSGKNYLQLSGLPAEKMEAGRPVTNLRYHSAVSYCEWLSKRTGMMFRLPTETEWAAAPGTPELSQYCLEDDRPPAFGPVLRGGEQRTPPPEWDKADPNRPVSTWWFRTGYVQGFRVVRVPGADDRAAYAQKIEITRLQGKETEVGLFMRVTGEVRNAGDRALDELALKVYHLDPKGRPHLEDVTSNLTRRATFNVCTIAVRNSARGAGPLRPGEVRTFSVDLPLTMDAEADVEFEKFGAEVARLRFAD